MTQRRHPPLSKARPDLRREWHPTRNRPLRPEDVSSGSGKAIWWRCPKDRRHLWQAAVITRAVRDAGCPFCSRRAVLPSDSLAALHPELGREWHPTKNGTLLATEVLPGSNRHVFWRCARRPSHVWRATVQSRTLRRTGCPYCSHHRVTRATSLAALHPQLAQEWHPTLNGTLTPSDVTPGSGKRVFWQCSRDPSHVWPRQVYERARNGKGCGVCSGKIVTRATSLAALFPKLLAEWHPTKNVGLSPWTRRPGSTQKVWWRCSKNPRHVWKTSIGVRTRTPGPTGCPFCSGRYATPATSLARLHRKLAGEWHPTKNGTLTPKDVRPGSQKRVWWRCRRDPSHEWQTSVASRALDGTGCGFCSGRRVTRATSLAAVRPDVAASWHPSKNGALTPWEVSRGSDRSVWWRCERHASHAWKTTVSNRSRGHGCPFCAGKRVAADNCLATVVPELAKEWHPRRNGALTPRDVTVGSSRVVWWRCRGTPAHEWQASVASRIRRPRTAERTGSRAAACPSCPRHCRLGGSLRDRRPALAREWHPTKNGSLGPEHVTPSSRKRVWWRCQFNRHHEWQTQVKSRTGGDRPRRCPICQGRDPRHRNRRRRPRVRVPLRL